MYLPLLSPFQLYLKTSTTLCFLPCIVFITPNTTSLSLSLSYFFFFFIGPFPLSPFLVSSTFKWLTTPLLPKPPYPSPTQLTLNSLSSLCVSLHPQSLTMSSRRSRSRQSGESSRITDDQIADLISKLQQLIPELRNRGSDKVSASKVLQETCNYIRNLHKEVDDLSDRLSGLLSSTDSNSAEAAIIRSLLM
ncbi:hypothetical protein ACSBR1_006593 [Camellia fascicularis]